MYVCGLNKRHNDQNNTEEDAFYIIIAHTYSRAPESYASCVQFCGCIGEFR